MTRTRATSLLAALVALAAAGLGRAADTPTFPPGMDFSKPAALQQPGKIVKWKAVIARDAVPVFKSFEGDDKLDAGGLKFGDVTYVVHANTPADKPHRYLLGRFN